MLEIVVYGHLYIVLGIYDIGFRKTILVEYDVFWKGKSNSNTITMSLKVMSGRVDPLSPVYKFALE